MITYSLDEFGAFENTGDVSKPIFIGGVMYDDHSSPQDLQNEKERIRCYYEQVILDAARNSPADIRNEFTYPEALHANSTDRERDHTVVRPVKEIIHATLAEFICQGTYQKKPLSNNNPRGIRRPLPKREGSYRLFLILKSDAGLSEIFDNQTNIFVQDRYGSNLYFHMVSSLLSKLIFHNPCLPDIRKISLNIATRSSGDLRRSDPLALQYKRLGYKETELADKEQVRFDLTNADVYRSLLSQYMIQSARLKITVADFLVWSISYKQPRGMEFFYLADSICSVFQYGLSGQKAAEWLPQIDEKFRLLEEPADHLLFTYDPADVLFSEAWQACENGNYYRALCTAFENQKTGGVFADYYRRQWFPLLEARIRYDLAHKKSGALHFSAAVNQLKNSILSNTFEQELCLYVSGALERIIDAAETEDDTLLRADQRQPIRYALYDAEMSAYCHIGDSTSAEICYRKCTALAPSVSAETFLQSRNRMAAFYCDSFEWEKALAISRENIETQEFICELTRGLYPSADTAVMAADLGKACSQAAQVLAFRRDPEAEVLFRKALSHFENGSPNYLITLSYLLHFYLDTGEQEKYLAAAPAYFGGRNRLSEQFHFILDEASKEDPLINPKYALYVWLRGLCLCPPASLSDALWQKLAALEDTLMAACRKAGRDGHLTGHPSELILKYLSLLALSRGEKELAERFMQNMKNSIREHSPILDCILLTSEAEYSTALGDFARRDALTSQTIALLRQKFPVFRDTAVPEDGAGQYQWLHSRLTFMFR